MFLHKKDMDRTRLHRERETKGDFYIPVPSQTLFPEEGRGIIVSAICSFSTYMLHFPPVGKVSQYICTISTMI